MHGRTYVGLVGLTYRRTHSEALAYFQLAKPYDAQAGEPAPVVALAEALGLGECLYMCTCNRVELWFVARADTPVTTIRRRFVEHMHRVRGAPPPLGARALHAYVDEGAWERLFVIAAALDAMVPGEAQVLGQLKAAWAGCQRYGLIGATLSPLMEAALVAAKDVREHTALGRGRTSMMSLVETHLAKTLAARTEARPTIAIVGTGEMARACAERLAQQDGLALRIVSRDAERARAVAASYKATPETFEGFVAALAAGEPIAAVLCATGGTLPVFDAALLEQVARAARCAPSFVDLGVPPNVDAQAAHRLGIDCVDYAALNKLSARHRAERHAIIAEARERIDVQLDVLAQKMQQKRVALAVRAWRSHCEHVLHERLAQLPAQATDDALGRWARQLTHALAHAPTQGLKTVAEAYGPAAVDAFVRGAQLRHPHNEEKVG